MVDPVSGLPPSSSPRIRPAGQPAVAGATGAPEQRFDQVLERSRLAFSKHALRRIEQRGLQLDQARLDRLEAAVDRAEAKGSRDSLVLLDELALVVSVRNHTVVTAMDEASRKEHVFTNIDSVVIAD